MVWKLFNAPNTSPFCNSFKVTLIRPFILFSYSFIIFQYSISFANISHFQIHASSPFTPTPRTVTSADMALAEVTGDLWFSVALPKCQTRHIPRAHAYFNSCVPTDAQGINSSSGLLQHVLAFPCSIGNLGCASLTFQHDFPRPIVYSKVGCVLCHIQKKAQRVAWEQTTTDGPTTYTNQPRHCPTMSSKHAGAGSVSH